ncbi:acyl carrier protein [Prochlorococcus sp. MIT 1341]|uniref:acyl carrier protein n=1 Tax=Prochlorococcus sp. MIT 1341 TaxID=3096221 RepID=UPI002A74CB29|nr:acyl carrier protein [Prochlorococcus sp. MIT 1341]
MDTNGKHSLDIKSLLMDVSYALNIDQAKLSIDSTSVDYEEWDSMGTISLIAHIEDKYNCKFDLMEMPLFNNVKSIFELLEKKGLDIKPL